MTVVAFAGSWSLYPLAQQLGALDTRLATFPSLWTIAWQTCVCVCIEDTMFYWTHRMLHLKAVYPYVHK